MITKRKVENGQAIVLLVLALVGMLAFAGLAVDGGMLYSDRRSAQNAADTAAMTGAYSLAANNLGSVVSSAMNQAKLNGFGGAPSIADIHHEIFDDGKTKTEVYWPPVDGPYAGDMRYVQVKIRHTVNTSFIQLVYPGLTRSEVQAVAKVISSGPTGEGNALVGLSPTECNTIKFFGDEITYIKDGGVFSNSNKCNKQTVLGCSDPCDSGWLTGTGIVTVENGSIQSVGSFDYPPGNLSPNPIRSSPIDYTLPPIPDCSKYTSVTASPDKNSGGTISQGLYHDITIGTGAILTMNPGVYCVETDFSVGNSTIQVSGTFNDGVFIYMMNTDDKSTFTISSDAKVYLRANRNTSNPLIFPALDAVTKEPIGDINYNGLLLYFNPDSTYNSNAVDISGNSEVGGANLYTGSIIAPSVGCWVTGTSETVTISAEIICNTVNVGGTGTLQMQYNAGDYFQLAGRADLSK
jgi:Flp pilus assembly protein TadG